MSSYPVLYNKPIDQWKVTELKEELKKRKLTTKGLKDDLIRRLDESIQEEIANANADKGFDSDPKPVAQGQDATSAPEIDETSFSIGKSDNKNTEPNNVTAQPNIDVDVGSKVQEQVVGMDTITSTDSTILKPDSIIEATVESSVQLTTLDTSVQETTVEISHEVTTVEFSPVVSGSLVEEINSTGEELQNNGTPNNILQQSENPDPPHEEAKLNSSDLENQVYEANKVTSDSISTDNVSINEKVEDLNIQPQNEDSNPPHVEANPSSVALETQVFEVSKVTSDSISIDNVSINEKIELKDNIIADDVKLEFDVKHGREEPSSSSVDLDDGNLQPMDIKEPQENEVKGEENGNIVDSIDKAKKNDSGDVELSEKLNLDRSSGDDSIEEDALESRQIESKPVSDEGGDRREKMEVTVVRENFPVDAMVDETSADDKGENKIGLAVPSAKRKPHEQEIVGNAETTKRQRRWNAEGLKVLEPHNDNASPSITPRDTFQSLAKRNFSRSDSMASVETPKERVVPPSSKPPTSALRIDRFLRPFTLKAVQELLGKTGNVTNFWMDHIKTHCYVSYSSVEEAIETRNAVYNLQWPPNGGRLLVAEFVEPQEVQLRVDAPPSPAGTVVPVLPTLPVPVRPQAPHVQVQRQVPPPLPTPPVSLPPPPPPPLANPPAARERALPPPPPLAQKVEPPTVTLDDLFRKTRATPRIYYLPLSDEQVKAKENAQGKPASSRD